MKVNKVKNNQKFADLINDRTFLEKIVGLNTIEEVQSEFNKRNVDISIEELETFKKLILEITDFDEELTEEELEKAYGGSLSTIFLAGTSGIIIGMIIQPILQALNVRLAFGKWLHY